MSSSSSSSFIIHHLANMQLGHLLNRSGVTHPEVSLMVSPGFFSFLICSILVFPVICYRTFCFYVVTNFFCVSALCPKLWLYLILLQFLCLIMQVYSAVFRLYFICAAVILLASLALMVQFSLPYNKDRRPSIILLLFSLKVFCSLNVLFIVLVIFK